MIETANQKEQELKSFQKLLAGPEKEFIDFGKAMSPNSKIIERENKLGELLERESLSKRSNTKVLNKEHILNEMTKYNLAFVRMDKYRGDFSIQALKEIKNFIKEKELKINDYDLKNTLFALYPKKSAWSLKNEDTNGTNDYMYNGNDEKNPTILHREGNYYHVIHPGTNYKNLFNINRGFLYGKNAKLYRALYSIVSLSILVFLTIKIIKYFGDFGELGIFLIVISAIIIAVANLIYLLYPKLSDISSHTYQFIEKQNNNLRWE